MNFLKKQPDELCFLLCADIDGPSSCNVAEFFVPLKIQFDCVFLCGPFIHKELNSKEETVTAEGDMASMIAQFENIVCRVAYLPCESDPPNTLIEQLHLTPNSVCLHGRRLNLTDSLFVSGFAEKGGNISSGKVPKHDDRSAESDEELESVEVKSGLSISIINEMLENGEENIDKIEKDNSSDNDNLSGIFILNYKFSHTLNQFLFHMGHILDSKGINLSIISSQKSDEVSRLPSKFGNLSIVSPKSLRNGGFYTIIKLSHNKETNKWETVSTETRSLYDDH